MSKASGFLLFLVFCCGAGLGQIRVSDCDIQGAINRCKNSCTISIAPGTCRLPAAITWAGTGKQINLECAGREQTLLICPTGVPCINLDSNSRIAHCDLRGPAVASASGIVNSGGTTNIVIEDNIIEKSGNMGINTGGSSLRWTIRNNLVQNNLEDGIFLASGTSDSVVAHNIIVNNGSNGIDCNGSENTFQGNVSTSNGLPGGPIDKNGILISGIFGGSSANYNTVVGNETDYNGGAGITIRADMGTTAEYNTVSGNVSHDNSGTSINGDGIAVDGSDLGTYIGNAVVGNTVYHNQRFGLNVDGQNATTVQDTLVSSNVAVGNGSTGIILGNPLVQDTLVVNNIVIGNESAQITDLGTTRSVIAGNKQNTTDAEYDVQYGINIGGGVAPDGTGMKHQSTSTGSVGPGGSAVVSLTWITPFADTNYDSQCSVVDPTPAPTALRIHHIVSLVATSVAVEVVNDDTMSAHTGTMSCLGIHQ